MCDASFAQNPSSSIAGSERLGQPIEKLVTVVERAHGYALVVLPLTTHGDQAESTKLLAGQLTDDLTNVLSRTPNLRVISRRTASSFEEKPIDVAAIGAELAYHQANPLFERPYGWAWLLELQAEALRMKTRWSRALAQQRLRVVYEDPFTHAILGVPQGR